MSNVGRHESHLSTPMNTLSSPAIEIDPMNQKGPFPRKLLIAPGVFALAFLAALFGSAAAEVKPPTLSGPVILLALALTVFVALVLQGLALLTAVPRLIRSVQDRTVANWLSTAFAVACVVPALASFVAGTVFIVSAGK